MTTALETDLLLSAKPRPIQWRRLGRALATLWEADPPKVLDAAFTVGDSLGGGSDERQLRRVLATETGQRLLAEEVSLADALGNHEALRALPEGSLGRAFLRFAERHGLEPHQLLESQHAMSRDYAELDPVRRWMFDRFTTMHDLWHVVAGYDATHAGESALMCFSLPQRVNDRALPIFVVMSIVTGRIGVRCAWRAFRRGRRARFLAGQPFEEFLRLPIEEARRRMGVREPRESHARAVTEAMLIPVEAWVD
jgi:ubiquinone biosynthesis protein COQ4